MWKILWLSGRQCSWCRTGVIWSRRGALLSTRAASFCSTYNLRSAHSGTPYNNELASSSLDITRDHMTAAQVASSRFLRTLLMLRRWKYPERTTWLMWGTIVRRKLSVTTRSLTVSDGLISASPMRRTGSWESAKAWPRWDTKMMNSVFRSLSLSCCQPSMCLPDVLVNTSVLTPLWLYFTL